MLRSTLARKVLRLRSLRTRRLLHDYDQSSSSTSNPLPILTHLPPSSEPPTHSFPLYHPPPQQKNDPLEYLPLNKDTLQSLPSDESISRQLKNKLTKKVLENLPDEVTETELKSFYSNLIKSGISSSTSSSLQSIGSPEDQLKLPLDKNEKEDILNQLEIRLLGSGSSSSTSQLSIDAPRNESNGDDGLITLSEELNDSPKHYKIFAALAQLAVPEDSPSSSLAGPSGTSKSPAGSLPQYEAIMDLPLGLVSKKEWNVLFDAFIQRKDARGAEALLDVMDLHGVPFDENRVQAIIEVDAEAGRVEDVGRLTAEIANSGLEVKDSYKDLYILSHLQQTPSKPENAIKQLTSAELMGKPYPQSSYSIVLKYLTEPTKTFQTNSQSRALAWDLFTNMRLTSYPNPSRELYNIMIKSCGESNQPEPERARDLWIEMTTDQTKEPTTKEYSSIIKALSSTKKDYLEAFDLLRQLLLKHHDEIYTPFENEDNELGSEASLYKLSKYVPDQETFINLLEGTKRSGDLNRARWILNETVKLSLSGKLSKEHTMWKDGINADLLSGVFMTYASWKPLVKRGVVKVKDKEEIVDRPLNSEEHPEEQDQAALQPTEDQVNKEAEWLDVEVLEQIVESSSNNSEAIQDPTTSHSNSHHAPQSSADAIREATGLFYRMIDDITATPDFNTYLPFRDVVLGPKLVNSYISVYAIHSPSLAITKKAYDEAWDTVFRVTRGNVKPNGWSYLQILEKCSYGNRGGISDSDRSIAFEWGIKVWEEYLEWTKIALRELDSIGESAKKERKKWLFGLGDRQIEKTWKSIIRLYALNNQPLESMNILQDFFRLYPPTDILKLYKPLVEIKDFKIRMTTNQSIPESNVPPYYLFNDLSLLHQKLLKLSDQRTAQKELAKLKFIVTSYEVNLKKRKQWRFKGIGQNKESKFRERQQKKISKSNRQREDDYMIEDGDAYDRGKKRIIDINEVD
ncbi:uncharacterized protein L201_007191 [Kwoniella dendrophila CBS 6074]|uniref:Pentatricopeptide repeat domain-containing protein n=1 Tax=Kwoniella dendrophila CBS 6074 TaxID=1295534 RepID=A0AAX4K3Q5_9TREE